LFHIIPHCSGTGQVFQVFHSVPPLWSTVEHLPLLQMRVLARHEEETDVEVHMELQSKGDIHTAASLGPSKPIQAPQVHPFNMAHKSAPIHSTLDEMQAALALRTGG